MSTASASTATVISSPFKVQSVLPAAAPTGGVGDWFRYVIAQPDNMDSAITGVCSGSLLEIQRQLAERVERLNERLGKIEAKKKTR